jgi:hypothetical protein
VRLEPRQGHHGIVTGHAPHRGEQTGQALVGEASRDLGADTAGQGRFVDDDAAPAGLD